MGQYTGHVRYARKSKICLFYLYATAKSEIQICSNKHETGLVHCIGNRLRAKKGPAPPPPLGNFADISYLEENLKPHLLRDVCTL